MKLNPLWILLAFVPAMNAEVITCNSGALSVPVFATSSVSGAVGDYTLDCTGGIPTPSNQAIPEVDFTAFMNVPILKLADGFCLTAWT